MCGRFARFSLKPVIIEEFGIDNIDADLELEPNYNVAPGQDILAVIAEGTKEIKSLKWGLVPSWSKDPSMGNKMINARSETLAEKPSFKNAFKKRRCLVIADGFYEWKKDEKIKRPFYITMKSGKPFGFAGLYEKWSSPAGDELNTCTIITTEPNDLLSSIHNRMPVILSKEHEDLWLNCEIQNTDKLTEIFNPYNSANMDAYEVSRYVNSPKNNTQDCIKPLEG